MPAGQSFPERLRSLRKGGAEALAPLWIEQLPAEEALNEVRGREGPLFRLQEVRFLVDLGRTDEAHTVLRSLTELSRGLARVRDALAVGVSFLPDAREPRGGGTEELAAPASSVWAGAEEALRQWLFAVRAWRTVSGV